MKERIRYIDTVKGLGILMITLGHITTIDNILDRWMSLSKVSVFYFVSGFLIAHSNTLKNLTFKQYAIKNTKRLMIPYFWFNIIAIVLRTFRAYLLGNDFISRLQNDFVTFITLRGISATWFLPTLLVSSCVFVYLIKNNSLLSKVLKNSIVIWPPIVMYLYGRLPEIHVVISNLILVLSKSLIAVWFVAAGFLFHRYVIYLDSDFWDMSYSGPSKVKGFFSSKSTINGLLFFMILLLLTSLSKGIDFNLLKFGKIPIVFYLGGIIGPISFFLIFRSFEKYFNYSPMIIHYFGVHSLLLMGAQRCFLFLNLTQEAWNHYIGKVETVNVYFYLESFMILALVLLETAVFIEFFYRIWKPFIQKVMQKLNAKQ